MQQKSQENEENTASTTFSKEDNAHTHKARMADILQDKQHKELLFYLSVAIFFLELIVGGVAFFYGIIHAIPGENGGPPQFQFPWLAYGLAAIMAPAALLLIVHMAGVGLFRSMQKKSPEEEAAWRENLPHRLQKVYTIIQGAPSIVLFLGVILIGVALFYVDGALGILVRMGEALAPYWPWIVGGGLGALCIIYTGKAYFAYRTRRMEQEYAFRREIFERTGQILVDKGTVQLPPAYDVSTGTTVALGGNAVTVDALPVGDRGENVEAQAQPRAPEADIQDVAAVAVDVVEVVAQHAESTQHAELMEPAEPTQNSAPMKETVKETTSS